MKEQVSYKVGDVIHLRSGSPDLTVIRLEDDATVEWIDDDGVLVNWTFPVGCFEKVESDCFDGVGESSI